MRTKQYGASKEAEDHAIATVHHSSLSLSGRAHEGKSADLPAIFHKTWQDENPDFLLCRTRLTSACHCACPRTAALRLALCRSLSRFSPFTFFVLTCAHQQKDFDGNLMRTKGY
jgi:hypothetical protein